MNERLEIIGKHAEYRQKLQRQRMTVEALRDKLRGLLPRDEDVLGLDGDAVLAVALSFQQEQGEGKELLRRLAVLNETLGG